MGFGGKQGGLSLRNLPPQIQEFFKKLEVVLEQCGADASKPLILRVVSRVLWCVSFADLSEQEIKLVMKGLPPEFFVSTSEKEKEKEKDIRSSSSGSLDKSAARARDRAGKRKNVSCGLGICCWFVITT